MTTATQINTIRELRKAIRKARRVMVSPRFGNFEGLVRISKADALWMIQSYNGDATADDIEMYGGELGRWDGDQLILGS